MQILCPAMHAGVNHDAYVAWAAACGRSPRTLDLDRVVARRFRALTGVRLEQAGRVHAERWWQAIAGLSPASRATYLRAARRYWRWAEDRGGPVDPSRRLVEPRVPRGLPRPVPARDVALALAVLEGDTRVQVALAAYAGLRVSEIAALRPQDVQDAPDGRPWLLVQGKGRKWRSVPLTSFLGDLLAGYGWPATNGRALTVAIRGALHAVGLPYSAHQLRHSFATEVLAASGNVVVVQRLLGHASVATTQVYADVAAGQLHDAVAAAFDPYGMSSSLRPTSAVVAPASAPTAVPAMAASSGRSSPPAM